MKVEFGVMAHGHTDSRRTISEINFPSCSFQSFVVGTSPQPMGNHFHKEKFELFHFISGGGTVRVAAVDENGNILGDVVTLKVIPGFTILIPPCYTHRFDLIAGTQFVCYSSKPFDPNDLCDCKIADKNP